MTRFRPSPATPLSPLPAGSRGLAPPTPTPNRRRRALAVFVGLSALAATPPALADEPNNPGFSESIPNRVRFATFNVSLYGERAGEVLERLAKPGDRQAECLAEIIQRVRPDVLLVNEIDYDPEHATLRAFCDNYLAVPQHASEHPDGPAEPIVFAYQFLADTNTGEPSGFDLDRNGRTNARAGTEAYGGDCWGFGRYQGQYGMAVLSRWPIDAEGVRTFQNFRWAQMPGAQLPDDPATPAPNDWYSAEALGRFPLSSKSHWDVPIQVGGRRIHLLASHPTPPIFDGPENRNGRRNHDEIRLWVDYVGPTADGAYIVDDAGNAGGLPAASSFVVVGDLNSDPHDGEGSPSINRLLSSPRIAQYEPPASRGAVEQAARQGGANAHHHGDPAHDTCDPPDDPGPGNLRLDYVLPSADLRVIASGVFWPVREDPLFRLVGEHPFPSSDHRLVWADVAIGEDAPE
ncbi:MAG: endonuclease/exonuclease/phosphatase family protein [Pirellulales bacterium]|nr:endonuclease/exonuclease/phosphatase family protein [Pirellulales bacterium]